MATFTLLVTSAPFDTQATAIQFAQAVLACGHRIEGVFFYQAGVAHANCWQSSPSDEYQPYRAWQQLAASGVPLHVCVTAAARRGLVSPTEMEERNLTGCNLIPPFEVSGLGQLVELISKADRLVQF
ncbi:sulfurtransferase complex subunit TusD [Bowmanella dokdonensis]|uniref:Sulfurtransferase complex subunit TusD n=1 Tax=Bowmanella dokdonensis TaxID=751969 RepID=A0A939DKL9_9ALTE|nr:sulfurtransferase complex subunit TusD [Bowmanella dokdonensis]MBN7824463.1 sulfurtransferase complex subunit TusD [Bowmanella dokdonensis]